MDRTQASEACNVGSIPTEGIIEVGIEPTAHHFGEESILESLQNGWSRPQGGAIPTEGIIEAGIEPMSRHFSEESILESLQNE